MIKTGFESRVKVQQIIENQIPEFILEESPKVIDFLKQYYISQEYQSGPSDIAENLDQYLKLDNLIPEVVADLSTLSANITTSDNVVNVSSTKGFPDQYGLLKIDDEIITYKSKTTTSFIDCVRGFSAITDYVSDDDPTELVFSTSSASAHTSGAKIQNLSSLFLKEFYKKLKYFLSPGLEDENFVSSLNVGNFLKEVKSFYQSKGTNESFRILFNILYNVTPKIVNLENYLIKPSSSEYIRREIFVAELLSGDPTKLVGQSIRKSTDDNTYASVSEVEILTRKGISYYKLSLFVGYDEESDVTGNFSVPGKSLISEKVSIGSSIITVDSTIGFGQTGSLVSGNNKIAYTSKSVNQFYGCSGVFEEISTASQIRSDEYVYGYENGDLTKKVELRLTGLISTFIPTSESFFVDENQIINVKNLGENIKNPDVKTYKQKISNSWIYNTNSRYKIDVISGATFTLNHSVDESNLKSGDFVDILKRDEQTIVSSLNSPPYIVSIDYTTNQIILGDLFGFQPVSGEKYDIRRKLKKCSSSGVSLKFGNNSLISDIQNAYSDGEDYFYVASNSLPSYTITENLFEVSITNAIEPQVLGFNTLTQKYSIISFASNVPFISGDKVHYYSASTTIPGLDSGDYFVEVLGNLNQIRLYTSRSFVGTENYVEFEGSQSGGPHYFILESQKSRLISAQNILRKFSLSPKAYDQNLTETFSEKTGILINGVEISNYKSEDKIYYGPLNDVKIVNGGSNFDVINPPQIVITDSSGTGAKIRPVIRGSVSKVLVDPQEIGLDSVVSIALTGGNGSGSEFKPVLGKSTRSIRFNAKSVSDGGGLDSINETITFLTDHKLNNGDQIIYDSNGNSAIGIGSFKGSNTSSGLTIKSGSTYYTKVINNTTIQLYNNNFDYVAGINTVGFTTIGNSGIHIFKSANPLLTLKEIKVINGGDGYENRQLIVKPTGISTIHNTINFNNHGFKHGDIVKYDYQTSPISGLSTNKEYKILKISDNSFSLCENIISSNSTISDFERRKTVKFTSTGSGYQYFKYPDISFVINYSSSGVGTVSRTVGIITSTPIIRGNIVDAYLYEAGQDYGSTILNLHRRPSFSIKSGKNAQLYPIVVNGSIEKVYTQFGGSEYHSLPDLIVNGDGTGAELRPVIVNGVIEDVVVVNPGIGYTQNTTSILVKPSGKNLFLDFNIRDLTVNKNFRYGNEVLSPGNDGLQYSVTAYDIKLQNEFNDNNSSFHSPLIGWSYDGNPIYGPYGYSDPDDSNSPTSIIQTGYKLDTSNVTNRPSGFEAGFFVEDYRYDGSGDLDIHNGRFCKTPEFEDGVYAYFATINPSNVGISSFPYFIGNSFRTEFISENEVLDQSFDFNSSSLLRNTFPYAINNPGSSNDFIFESYDYANQDVKIESVSSGSIESAEIVSNGIGYKVNEYLLFDNSKTNGSGVRAKVSEVTGKDIVSLNTSIDTYSNSVVVWENGETLKVKVSPNNNLLDRDLVAITGINTTLSSIKKSQIIGISSYSSKITQNVPANASTGIVTDIYISEIPSDVSIGSTVVIESESLLLLNVFKDKKIIRVRRDVGAAHTATTKVNFVPNTFTISQKTNYFDSKINETIYFNPSESVGLGLSVGITSTTTFALGFSTVGVATFNRLIPTKSVYIENHPFKNNQKVIFKKPNSSSSSLSISTSFSGTPFNLPQSGISQTVYVTNKSKNTIGIKTSINSDEVFFVSNGANSNNYEYSFETDYNQVTLDIQKFKTTVSVSTSHNLSNGDEIKLNVQPSLTVGIQTYESVYIKLDGNRQNILINPIGFSSSGINTVTNTISITSHSLKTGDKVYYESLDLVAAGLETGSYYVNTIDDDTINLCETYIDSVSSSPTIINITGIGGAVQTISLINPTLRPVKNNNIKFNLSDSSLVGYNFKLYYDSSFNHEFTSVESDSNFNISGLGTVGVSTNAALTLNYSENLPEKLYYTLEKGGYISTSDTEVVNASTIIFTNSVYNGTYAISGIGQTTFTLSLTAKPEKLSYTESDCDTLKYTTNSTTTTGGISKIKFLSSGSGYKSLPSFIGVETIDGSGADILLKSSKIGKINDIRVINSGFEYPSDKTLKPSAFISPSIDLISLNKIYSVGVSSGGNYYEYAPDLITIDSVTREVYDSGFLSAKLNGQTISSVEVVEPVYGVSSNLTEVIAINNTNGISINTVETSNTGIITCYLITPIQGFSNQTPPFNIGDSIFVEGIANYDSGSGYNSSDYGYRFFTVTDYQNTNPAVLKFNVSDYTTSPGIANTSQNSLPSIINIKNYPIFDVNKEYAKFIVGEQLLSYSNNQYNYIDLYITKSLGNLIKVTGDYELSVGEKIKGSKSGAIATIKKITEGRGIFEISHSLTEERGWNNDIGKLNDDQQVTSDNDYYQNLSYTIKSPMKWDTLSTPVNRLVHPSGMKNFADTQIQKSISVGIKTTKNETLEIVNIIGENRIDEINIFDLSQDVDVLNNTSKFVNLLNKKLSSYINCTSNRVISIDDISSQFSNSGVEDSSQNIVDTISESIDGFFRYLIQTKSTDQTEYQINEIVIIKNGQSGYILEKLSLSNKDSLIATFELLEQNENNNLTFIPKDPYTLDYDIKILSNKFATDIIGSGTTNFGLVKLTSGIKTCGIGTTSIVSFASTQYNSFYFNLYVKDKIADEMNYVDVYLSHDGSNTYLSEYYFDSERTSSSQSFNKIGTLDASLENGVISLNFDNDRSNIITVGSKVVGFGTSTLGIGTFRYKVQDQVEGTESTSIYKSNYVKSTSGIATIISESAENFTTIKSTVSVSVGSSSALHQIAILNTENNTYSTNYPLLSVGSTTGIGTFGVEIESNNIKLKFYADPNIQQNVDLFSYSELIYTNIDKENIPNNLEYGVIEESIDFIEYGGISGERVKRLDFDLNHKTYPIFKKSFNPSNSDSLDLSSSIITIKNHFFNTGEELIYEAGSSLSGITSTAVGIGSTLNSVGVVTNILPSTVYPIKLTEDTFRLSTRRDYAQAGIYVTFTSIGSGNKHTLESTKKLEKSLITVDDVVQYPLTYSLLSYTLIGNGGQIGIANTIFSMSGISSIRSGDVIKINNEYMKVVNIGYGTSASGPITGIGTINLVQVDRAFVGSSATSHTDSTSVNVYRGSYNISGNKIFFTDPPNGDFRTSKDERNLSYLKSNFNGRVFLRKNYSTNQLYDNVSENFTGIGQTYTLTINGINTVGLGSTGGNGIVFINGIFQTPSTQNNTGNNYEIIENTSVGISSIIFTGSSAFDDNDIISVVDVNQNQLPRGGIIVSLGSTGGLGYAPLVGASVTAVVGAGGSIVSVGFGSTDVLGSGYYGIVSIGVTEPGHTGSAATITATVGAGGSLSFNVIGGGSGYVTPTISIPSPSYSNLECVGVSRLGVGSTTDTGVGLLLNIEVSAASTTGIGSTLFEVSGFSVQRGGYGYVEGDVITPVGLVTAKELPSPLSTFELTVVDTFTDSFAAWQFGELDYIDSIKNLQNGVRIRFPLYYNSNLLNFEVDENDSASVEIDLSSILLIFINGILQEPSEAYSFEGGSSVIFASPPKPEDNVAIFFYRGTRGEDSNLISVFETIKPGDNIRLRKNNTIPSTVDQEQRSVHRIFSSDIIETNLYNRDGIDEENQRSLSWIKQKKDRIINSEFVYKSRDSLESRVYPTAKIIYDLNSSDSEVFVDDAQFFNYEENEGSGVISSVNALIVNGNDPVSAAITAVVSAAGTISALTINNAGSGYSGATIQIKISSPKEIGVGVGTTATATVSIVNGSISSPVITNPGFGYSILTPPQVIVPLPSPSVESIIGITNVQGFSGIITGITTTTGVGTDLAYQFNLQVFSPTTFVSTGLQTGYPIYIYDTTVGNGVTSIDNSDSEIVGIGTTFADNVYKIHSFTSVGSTNASIICNVQSNSVISGISTFGYVQIGKFSWGKLSGFSRSSSPISIGVTANTIDVGLSTFPTIQRRGYGFRDSGALKKNLE